MITDITGKPYNLGPYRPPQQEQQTADPMRQFKRSLADSGIPVEES